jgi:hypothetical protein
MIIEVRGSESSENDPSCAKDVSVLAYTLVPRVMPALVPIVAYVTTYKEPIENLYVDENIQTQYFLPAL